MSILWCGGEDISFQNGGIPSVDTSDTQSFRSTHGVRCGLYIRSGSAAKGNQFAGGAVTSCWMCCYMGPTNTSFGNPPLGTKTCGLGQFSSQNSLIVTYDTTTNGKLALTKYDGTTYTQLAAETGVSGAINLIRIDMQVINYGASATVNVYANSVLIITFTGNVAVSGMTAMDCCVFGPAISAQQFLFSEFIVADEDTRNFSLITQYPNGAGTTDQWTGAYTDVNEITLNDGTSVYTSTAAQDEQFTVNSIISGTYSIKAVMLAARATKSAASPINNLKLGWYTNGSLDVDSGHALTTAWACYERLALQNPVTANIWQTSEVNGLLIDLQSAT